MGFDEIDEFDNTFASFKRDALAGDAASQRNLGICYASGSGVAAGDAEAVKWFKRAAEAGDANAQFNLGYCYDKGSGVAADVAEAFKWYKRAAEGGDATAQTAFFSLMTLAPLPTKQRRSSGLSARLRQEILLHS